MDQSAGTKPDWGPMMSEAAFFVKDVSGPKGSVSIVMAETTSKVKSDDIKRPHQDESDLVASRRHVKTRRTD